MAKIFYSLAGEGRGHSVRTKTIVDHLAAEHEVIIYTFGMAYQFLRQVYKNTHVEIRHIAGLNFHYNQQKQLDYTKTFWHSLKYLSELNLLIKRLSEDIHNAAPDLVISDFEPVLPRAARKEGIPVIAINHQYCLSMYNLSAIPPKIRFHAACLGRIANFFSVGQIETIVSAFFFPPLRPEFYNVKQIGVMIRDELTELVTEDKEYLLVYLKKHLHKPVLTALKACGIPVKIYGLGSQPTEGNLEYFPISNDRFLEDLAGCRAIVATGGNQLLGEVSYLRKPVLTIPEPGNYEQYVNAYYLEQSGGGKFYEVRRIKKHTIRDFIDQAPRYICRTPRQLIYGNTAALNIINQRLAAMNLPVPRHTPLVG